MKNKFDYEFVETGIPEIDKMNSYTLQVSGNLINLTDENKNYIQESIKSIENILDSLSPIEEKYLMMYLRIRAEEVLRINEVNIFDDGGIKSASVFEAVKRKQELNKV